MILQSLGKFCVFKVFVVFLASLQGKYYFDVLA